MVECDKKREKKKKERKKEERQSLLEMFDCG
jgi:hypothetical protein